MTKEAEIFFVAECMRHARKLPPREEILFLEGMTAAIGNDHPLTSHLSVAIQKLQGGDDQLELIESGQLKLDLPDFPSTPAL